MDEPFEPSKDLTAPKPAPDPKKQTRPCVTYVPCDNLLEHMCVHIANGGDAIKYIHVNCNFSYGYMMKWVNEDKARKAIYDTAISQRTEWMIQRLIDELKSLAFSDINEMYDEKGKLKDVKDIPEGLRRAIAGIETDEIYEGYGEARELIGYTKKVKLWDKKGAIDSFMKHLGMFIDKLEIKQTVTVQVKKVDLDERIAQLTTSRLN